MNILEFSLFVSELLVPKHKEIIDIVEIIQARNENTYVHADVKI